MARRSALEPSTPRVERSITPLLSRNPGTYALGLRLDAHSTCRIGALGEYTLQPGNYIYVGSAWGPGGLAARLSRHLRGSGKIRWHIDYLRQLALPSAAWIAVNMHLECTWAKVLQHHPHASMPIPGFGASDCRCPSHLFYIDGTPVDHIVLPGNPAYIKI